VARMGHSPSAYAIFVAETEGRDDFEDLRAHAKAVLQWICKKNAWKGVDRIQPAQDSDKWWAHVHAVGHEPSGK
jgi:hypothetical protein